MNTFYTADQKLLEDDKLTAAAGLKKPDAAVLDRLRNGYICDCKSNGEFVMMAKLPPHSSSPYARCRKCGCVTPLVRKENTL